MQLIITEKPSVALDFAKALSNDNFIKREGYIEFKDYCITWAFGHLLRVDDSLYNNGPWSFDSLPILPQKFDYTPITDKKKQLTTIISLLKRANSFIVATDAGREGELIAREILLFSNTHTTKGFRFWSSEALSPQVVLNGLNNLKPLSSYDSLFFAAYARQISDWIVGVNFTRFFSLTAKSTWSVGRVQTPTLALIVNRQKDVEHFTPQKYFTVTAKLLFNNVNFSGTAFQTNQKDNPERFTEENADYLVKSLSTTTCQLRCKDIKKENKQKNPPLLHSLTSLQREANRKFGFTAQQTLDIAQKLYETHKCISYPRSDSNHLAESSFDLAKEKLNIFSQQLDTDINRPGKRVFDTSKLTDHHAIIPLQPYGGSDPSEKAIFTIILNTFLSAFMKPFSFEETTITLSSPNEYINFISRGRVIKDFGFKSINQKFSSEEEKDPDEEILSIPNVSINVLVNIISCTKNLKFTEPPKRYTDDSILAIMEKYNLGTPATRASILERLFSVSYLLREKKNIIATEKGVELIGLLKEHDCSIHNVDITSKWENELDLIYKNNTKNQGFNAFVSNISSYTSSEIKSLMGKNIVISSSRQATNDMLSLAKKLAKEKNINEFDKGNTTFDYVKNFISLNINTKFESKCPCGGTILDDKYYFFCKTCGKKVSKTICEKTLSHANVIELFSGKSPYVKGLKSQKGSKFDAYLKLLPDNKIKFEFK